MARPKNKDIGKELKEPKVWRTVNIEPEDDEIFREVVKKTVKDRYIVFREMLKSCYPDMYASA